MQGSELSENEEKLKRHITINRIPAEHLSFKQSCHSVEEAAAAAKAQPEDFVKNICLIDKNGKLVVAILKGEDKVSITKVGTVLETKNLRFATPTEILEKTGYPCGGTPSFGYLATFLIDPRVLEKEIVFSGGGSEKSLTKISSRELQKANNGRISDVHK